MDIFAFFEMWQLAQEGMTILKRIVDGVTEWGVDEDGDGEISDYEVRGVLEQQETAIIIVSPDGEMMVYDQNGQITEEECDTAYSLWVAENGIMSKELDNYTVQEGLTLLMLLIMLVYFIKSMFTRKDVYR